MRHEVDLVGIIVIRAEAQGGRIHMTVRSNPDVRQVSTEEVRAVADIEAAVRAVREFLTEFPQTGK